ncbi:M20/M25/M40 family metallo-hydrolase [Stackebrandtia soli]|uniref:M20/M25/M40 family metallo-hydrolase n=1 Tax=Stackebrandtia soli TaxID=1892856 RepID=UPI0039E93A46
MRRIRTILIAVAATLAVGTYSAGPAAATPAPAAPLVAPDIDVNGVLSHLGEFQSIADTHGNRAAGTAGYDASADYVANALTAAGFDVERQTCLDCTSPDDNIIADWPGGDTSSTIMLGAHLDGVRGGPGANDNGSGSAALLEVALTLAETAPTMAKHVRFAWWADEEQGLNGSSYYVDTVDTSDLEVYLNFDMIGSANAGYFVTDINGTYGQALAEHLTAVGKAPDPMTECCSDDLPFEYAGVPTAFLSTGASAVKTTTQAAKWGGTAGQSFDPCYHRACDAYPSNINAEAINHTADAIGHALWTLAVT